MNILALDRGTKKIGIARCSSTTRVALPIGYLPNNTDIYEHITSLIETKHIDTIVYGKPHHPRCKQQLDDFIVYIDLQHPKVSLVVCDEAYTTVQADVLLESPHHPGQDAVAAMYILDTYLTENTYT